MHLRFMQTGDLGTVRAFLQAQGLPIAGVMTHKGGFLLAQEQGKLLGTVGVEIHGQVGLLRSVAVAENARSQGLATQLVGQAIAYASQSRVSDLYLLTTTAQDYFPRFGFKVVPRIQAPAVLQASAEFQGACPDSAVLVHLPLKEPPMTLTAQPNTASFLQTVRDAPELPLEFRLNGQPLVPAGYHVTEVKAVTIESMDCGGKANAWKETVVQLMDGTPDEAREGFMTTRKFLSIYDRVAARIPVHGDAEIRFEYGNVTTPALQYHLVSVQTQGERVVVELQLPGVMCKATGASSSAGQCCGPSKAASTPGLIQLG
ncbi:arsenic resistance N-acetyltransferase ArsN2 [Deinococcus sp. PESE-13]